MFYDIDSLFQSARLNTISASLEAFHLPKGRSDDVEAGDIDWNPRPRKSVASNQVWEGFQFRFTLALSTLLSNIWIGDF